MTEVEFSGLKGRFFAWFMTSPLRAVLNKKMGNPDTRFMELMALTGAETVVDSGCGSGHHSWMVAEALPRGRVIAVDVSKEMLQRLESGARKRGLLDRIEPMLADGRALPVQAGSADRAYSVAVWHHMDDPQAGCKELVRVLRPGGRAVVIDLAIQGGKKAVKGLSGHDRAFGEEDMKRILEGSGLVDVQVESLARWVVGTGVRGSRSL